MPTLRRFGLLALIVGALGAAPWAAGAQTAAAWILWEKNYTTKGTAATTAWEPQDGFEKLADCRAAGQQLLRFALDYMKTSGGKLLGPVQLDGRAAMFATPESGAQQTIDIRYLGFPGPFDPRPHQ